MRVHCSGRRFIRRDLLPFDGCQMKSKMGEEAARRRGPKKRDGCRSDGKEGRKEGKEDAHFITIYERGRDDDARSFDDHRVRKPSILPHSFQRRRRLRRSPSRPIPLRHERIFISWRWRRRCRFFRRARFMDASSSISSSFLFIAAFKL